MRQWRLNPVSYGVLNMDGSTTVGVIEIKLVIRSDGLYQCLLAMTPSPVGRSDHSIVAKPSDNKNVAMRNLTEVIDRFPIFEGKIT